MPIYLSLDGTIEDEEDTFALPQAITFDQHQQGVRAAQSRVGFERAEATPETWGEYGLKKLPFVGSIINAGRMAEVYSAATRVREGNAGQDDYDTIATFLNRQKDESERNWFERTGDLAASMPGFALEFIATSGAFSGGRAALTKLIGEEAAGRFVGRAATAAAGAAAQTVANPQRIAESTMRRRMPVSEPASLTAPTESMAESSIKGLADQFIEMGTERMGAQLAGAIGLNRLKNAILARLANRGLSSKESGKTAAALLAKAGYHGIPEELLEEHAGELARYKWIEEDAGVLSMVARGELGAAAAEEASRAVAFGLFPAARTAIGAVEKATEPHREPKLRDIMTRVQEGGAPSRAEAKELGIPPEQSEKQGQRRQWFLDNYVHVPQVADETIEAEIVEDDSQQTPLPAPALVGRDAVPVAYPTDEWAPLPPGISVPEAMVKHGLTTEDIETTPEGNQWRLKGQPGDTPTPAPETPVDEPMEPPSVEPEILPGREIAPEMAPESPPEAVMDEIDHQSDPEGHVLPPEPDTTEVPVTRLSVTKPVTRPAETANVEMLLSERQRILDQAWEEVNANGFDDFATTGDRDAYTTQIANVDRELVAGGIDARSLVPLERDIEARIMQRDQRQRAEAVRGTVVEPSSETRAPTAEDTEGQQTKWKPIRKVSPEDVAAEPEGVAAEDEGSAEPVTQPPLFTPLGNIDVNELTDAESMARYEVGPERVRETGPKLKLEAFFPSRPFDSGTRPLQLQEVEQLQRDGTPQDVPLSELAVEPVQEVVDKAVVEHYQKTQGSPIIVRPSEEGGFVIEEGRHRAVAAKLEGHETIPAYVVDVDTNTLTSDQFSELQVGADDAILQAVAGDEDAAQETHAKLATPEVRAKYTGANDQNAFNAWAATVARNTQRDMGRKQRRSREVPSGEAMERMESVGATPEQQAMMDEEAETPAPRPRSIEVSKKPRVKQGRTYYPVKIDGITDEAGQPVSKTLELRRVAKKAVGSPTKYVVAETTYQGETILHGDSVQQKGMPRKEAEQIAQDTAHKAGWVDETGRLVFPIEEADQEPRKAASASAPGGGVNAQMMPDSGEMGMPDARAGGESFDYTPPQQGTKKTRIVAHPVPMPEMVQLVKSLLGSVPTVKNLKKYLGFFEGQEGNGWARMVINAVAAKDEALLAKVLAHEAGHMVDWFDGKTMRRGNVLGRIGNLRSYMKKWLEKEPGAAPPLTDADRARLQREAARLLQRDAEIEIEEEVVERFDITPEDIINIWNSVEESSNPDLLRYIKRLGAAEKLSIIKEAFRGVVPEDVQQFAKETRRKTGKKIKVTVEKDAPPDDIHAKYLELLREETQKRELLSHENIREELIRLTEWWTPFDRATSSDKYIKYRESSRELYAEALSVMLNAPNELAQRAPEFWRGFGGWISEKPEVLKAYLDTQAILNGGSEKVSAIREEIRQSMFLEGEQKILAAEAAREAARLSPMEMARSFLTQYIIDRGAPVTVRARKGTSNEAQAAYYIMEELSYAESRNYRMLRRIKEHVADPLFEAGVSEGEIGDYLLLRRVVNERNEIANPLGYTPGEAANELNYLREKLGGERFQLLESKLAEWHDILFESVEDAVAEGVYSREKFENDILPNKGNYATFAVIKYLEDHIGPGLHKQIGTFEGVANPWDATTMKFISLNRLIELNRAKNRTRDMLHKEFDGDIQRIKIPYRAKEPKGPAKPGHDYLTILEDGRLAAYEVPREIAESFKSHDIGGLVRIANLIQTGVYKTFHPLFVTYNPGFIAANPIRDLRRTWVNMGAIGSKWSRELQEELRKQGLSKAAAKRAAAPMNITFGQVLDEFMRARRAATQHLTGTEHPVIEQMYHDRVLSVPYVEITAETGDTAQAGRLMQRYGIKEPNEKQRHAAIAFAGKFLNMIKREGARQELAGKLSAWNLVSKRMKLAQEMGVDLISEQERAHAVRRYAGTPDFKQKGLATPLTNSIWMYSNVKWQGLVSDMALGRPNSGTAAGWWWRMFVGNIVPSTLTTIAKYGGYGVAVAAVLNAIGEPPDEDEYDPLAIKKKMRRIPSYFLDNYDVLPIGTAHDTTGRADKAKTLFITIPKDETGRTISRLWGILLEAAIESAGGSKDGGIPDGTWSELFGEVKDALVPSLAPPIDIVAKWIDYWDGNNPRDTFFNSLIVPDTEFEAGGWESTKKMLAWTESKFGVAGDAAHMVTSPFLGQVFTPNDETVAERLVQLPLGHHRFLRLSNRGISEEEYAEIEANERESARFRARLPDEARYLTKQHFRLSRLDDSKLSPSQRTERYVFKKWYYHTYLPTTRAMKATDDNEQQAQLREHLTKASKYTIDSANKAAKRVEDAWRKHDARSR